MFRFVFQEAFHQLLFVVNLNPSDRKTILTDLSIKSERFEMKVPFVVLCIVVSWKDKLTASERGGGGSSLA